MRVFSSLRSSEQNSKLYIMGWNPIRSFKNQVDKQFPYFLDFLIHYELEVWNCKNTIFNVTLETIWSYCALDFEGGRLPSMNKESQTSSWKILECLTWKHCTTPHNKKTLKEMASRVPYRIYLVCASVVGRPGPFVLLKCKQTANLGGWCEGWVLSEL